jgi:hypothetical protein
MKHVNRNKEIMKKGKELLPPAKRGSLGNTTMNTNSFNNKTQATDNNERESTIAQTYRVLNATTELSNNRHIMPKYMLTSRSNIFLDDEP